MFGNLEDKMSTQSHFILTNKKLASNPKFSFLETAKQHYRGKKERKNQTTEPKLIKKLKIQLRIVCRNLSTKPGFDAL